MRIRYSAENVFVPKLRLFHDIDKFRRHVARHNGGECEGEPEGEMFYHDGTASVYISPRKRRRDETAALIAHEAYHASVAHFKALGEDDPGEEVMAYAIQSIYGPLYLAQKDWEKR